jgi:hypothetical protein
MKTMRTVTSVVALLSVAALAQATPWFTQDPRTLPAGKWRVEEHLLYSDIDNSLVSGDSAPLAAGVSEASAFTAHTRVRYGVRDDLTVFIDLPHVTKRVHTANGVLENSGLGDITLLAKYKYSESKEKGRRNAFAAFYKPHNGDYKSLPGLLATGSGQDNVGLIHLWEWRIGDDTWYANTGYVWRGERSDNHLDPGDRIVLNLAAEHKIGDSPWNFVWEVNGQHEPHATQAGQRVPNSGATIVSLTPGVQYIQKDLGGAYVQWEAGVQLPVITEGDLPALPDYTVYVGAFAVF